MHCQWTSAAIGCQQFLQSTRHTFVTLKRAKKKTRSGLTEETLLLGSSASEGRHDDREKKELHHEEPNEVKENEGNLRIGGFSKTRTVTLLDYVVSQNLEILPGNTDESTHSQAVPVDGRAIVSRSTGRLR